MMHKRVLTDGVPRVVNVSGNRPGIPPARPPDPPSKFRECVGGSMCALKDGHDLGDCLKGGDRRTDTNRRGLSANRTKVRPAKRREINVPPRSRGVAGAVKHPVDLARFNICFQTRPGSGPPEQCTTGWGGHELCTAP